MSFQWEVDCKEVEKAIGVPWQLLDSVIAYESGGQPDIVSDAGAVGLMQIIPKFHPECGGAEALKDPLTNIQCGASILYNYNSSRPVDWTDQATVERTLACYCWGPANVEQYPVFGQWPKKVQRYCRGIWETYQRRLKEYR